MVLKTTADAWDRRPAQQSNSATPPSSTSVAQNLIQVQKQVDAINVELASIRNKLTKLQDPPLTPQQLAELKQREAYLVKKKNDLLLNAARPIYTKTYTPYGAAAQSAGSFASGGRAVLNASVAKEAYFASNESLFNNSALGSRSDQYIYASNSPTALSDAMALWRSHVQGNKGLIQTWEPPGGIPMIVKDNQFSPVDQAGASSYQKAGMQFVYNPSEIGMSYGGVLEADMMFIASGKDVSMPFNSVFQSKLSIDIVLNRMFDMKYIGAGSGYLLPGVKPSNVWTGRVPTITDRRAIFEKGTMYDLEFLLQAMYPIGKLNTQLRGKTSDLGFLGNFPVEFHLGKSLRYVAQIESLQIQHKIFDHRMVPLFSIVSISAGRIPDLSSIPSTTAGAVGSSGGASGSGSARTVATGAIGRPGGFLVQ